MGIGTAQEYVEFFLGLEMGSDVSLFSFLSNERRVLKQKIGADDARSGQIRAGIAILDTLIEETVRSGQDAVIQKYTDG